MHREFENIVRLPEFASPPNNVPSLQTPTMTHNASVHLQPTTSYSGKNTTVTYMNKIKL